MAPSVSDPTATLGALRRYRRRKRLAAVHWVDALYQTYLTALLFIIAELVVSGFVGDGEASPAGIADMRADGPAFLGLVAAMVIGIGLRSGSRGGPLALERADVRHVLLAPIDRGRALRAPALRQLRFSFFVACIAGAVAGELAGRRLPGNRVEWVAAGVSFAAVIVALALGAAMVVSGLRIRPWQATGLALILVGGAAADVFDVVRWWPTEVAGDLALWPLHTDPWIAVPPAIAVVLLLVGLRLVGRISLEAAERRSTLIGQIRFAATLQDVRTVIVLRRQLALELPRISPWVRLRVRHGDRLPVWTRGWRGLLRWPGPRVGRAVLLAAVAGLAARAAWSGTTPLLVVAGLALFVVALDAVEPLAQEVDHPTRRDTVPEVSGRLSLRHLPQIGVVMVLLSAVAAGVAVVVDPSMVALETAAAAFVPAGLAAAAAGVISVLMGAPDQGGGGSTQMMLPPEAAGMRLAVRAVWPPLVAALGCAPVLAARVAYEDGHSPSAAAANATLGVAIVVAMVVAWVRFRDDARAWWKVQVEQMFPAKDEPAEAKASDDDGE